MYREFERDIVMDVVMKGRTSSLLMLSRASHAQGSGLLISFSDCSLS